MSWLFGIKQGSQNTGQAPTFAIPPPGDDGGNSDKKGDENRGGGKMDAYRFDSAALERAAKAAKDLEKSRMYNFSFILKRYLTVFFKCICKVKAEAVARVRAHSLYSLAIKVQAIDSGYK